MGLDTTHNCWHGPYSYFNEWRAAVAKAAGIPDLKAYWKTRNGVSVEQVHGLWFHMPEGGPLAILFNHSDCEGYILAHHCEPLADALEELLSKLDPAEIDHELTRRFIGGLREAAAAGQNVEFC